MTMREKGYEHRLYNFDPIIARPRLDWPGGARVAVCLVLHLEYWELEPAQNAVRDPRFNDAAGYYFPDYRTYSWREYGNRVGIFRILDILDRLGRPVTVAANAEACRRYPYLVETLAARGYEFAAHGTHATRMISSQMSESEERTLITASIEAIESATGSRPTGWIGQDFGESTRTPRLVAESGLQYIMDWANDDQPYAMTVDRPLLSIPNQAEWDDVQVLWHRRVTLSRYAGLVADAFDRLHQEGAAAGRYFGLHIHPWLMGAPHRIHQLKRALAHLDAADQVWWATAGNICGHVLGDIKPQGTAVHDG
jgi:peptidoglycan/xylan/chitin deacetylase (PgdA/CDA1 family)